MQKNIKILFIFIIVLSFLLIGCYFFNIKLNEIKKITYQQGWEDAKARLYQQIGPIAEENKIINIITGEIVDINEKQIVLKLGVTELLSDPELDNRNIFVDDSTKIFKYQMKSNEEYQKDLSEYYQANNIDPVTFIPNPDEIFGPDRFEQVEAVFSSLSAGQTIAVYADKNIGKDKSFTAAKILISVNN